jgi:asparagine synthase (glutamine-hydrolysing)
MSVILGIYRRDGGTVNEPLLVNLAPATIPFAPDGARTLCSHNVGMAFQLFATSGQKPIYQILRSDRGDMVAVDGRLDNARELASLFGYPELDSDAEVILLAFSRLGEACFSQLVGDWSLALWSSTEECLYLARDHAGTRTLYYSSTNGMILWSTYLESFFVDQSSRPLNPDFVSRYLLVAPLRDATPYQGIEAIPAAHYLRFSRQRNEMVRYWSPVADQRIVYRSDTEYERHLFQLLSQAVERRSSSGDPVIAQLSGGLDSTSIVAISDCLSRSQGVSGEGLIDTVSLLDPDEPTWNELPYVQAFEEGRGKVGTHMRTSFLDRDLEIPPAQYLLPGADASTLRFEHCFEEHLGVGRYRAILSGIGGDELLGGIPNPVPELAALLVQRHWSRLFEQAVAWSMSLRASLWHLLPAVCRLAIDSTAAYTVTERPPWLTSKVKHVQKEDGFDARQCLPNTMDRALMWEAILETMPHRFPSATIRYEYRYPLLDRDLVDFLLMVPSEQLLRPGQRRSLMRRALKYVLPPSILGRTRKASLKRGPLLIFEMRRKAILGLLQDSLLAQYGYIDPQVMLASAENIREPGFQRLRPALMRALELEIWLRGAPPLN